jgi:hypothetical protein
MRVFYHCQIDGLAGPPLEIAWAFVAPGELGVVSETHFVRPPPEWAPEIIPDVASALSRGIILSELKSYGTVPLRIAGRMNRVFAKRELFSAHPTDHTALKRIFEAAGIEPRFESRQTNAEVLIGELARSRRVTDRSLVRAKRKAELLSPLGDRPEAKARYFVTLWATLAGPV